MTIKEYTRENTPHGFIGLRVTAWVAGECRQQYFPATPAGWREAKALDRLWRMEVERRKREARPSSNSTGPVLGIHPAIHRKEVVLADGRQVEYEYRYWRISIAEVAKNFSILKYGDKAAFDMAVELLCQVKGWDSDVQIKLKRRWQPHKVLRP